MKSLNGREPNLGCSVLLVGARFFASSAATASTESVYSREVSPRGVAIIFIESVLLLLGCEVLIGSHVGIFGSYRVYIPP